MLTQQLSSTWIVVPHGTWPPGLTTPSQTIPQSHLGRQPLRAPSHAHLHAPCRHVGSRAKTPNTALTHYALRFSCITLAPACVITCIHAFLNNARTRRSLSVPFLPCFCCEQTNQQQTPATWQPARNCLGHTCDSSSLAACPLKLSCALCPVPHAAAVIQPVNQSIAHILCFCQLMPRASPACSQQSEPAHRQRARQYTCLPPNYAWLPCCYCNTQQIYV